MFILKTTLFGMLLVLVLLLQGCGRKGPLYMQQVPPKPAPAAKPQAVQNQTQTLPNLPVQSAPAQSQPESQKQP